MPVSTNNHSISAKKVAETECSLSLTYFQVPNKRGPKTLGDWEISEKLIDGES